MLHLPKGRKRDVPGVNIPVSVILQSMSQGRKQDGAGGGVPERSSRSCAGGAASSQSLSSHPQLTPSPPRAGSRCLGENILLPKGAGLTALDIQLVNARRRWQAPRRQQGWISSPCREGALPMHPAPVQEEISHPMAGKGLAHALNPGRRLQLLTLSSGWCSQKAPDTTGSHVPERQVMLWKRSCR